MPTFNTLGMGPRRLFHNLIHDVALTAFFPLNEVTGTIYDRCTRYGGIQGTAAGNPTYSKAITNGYYGLDFDGTGDLIGLGTPTGLTFEYTNAFSVLAVVVPDNLSQARVIVGKYDLTADRGWYFRLSADASPLLSFVATNGAANLLNTTSTAAVTEGAASMVGVSYAGTGAASGVAFYIDGTASATVTVAEPVSATILTADAAQIGARDSTELWNGDLAFIAVFSEAKSQEVWKRWAYLGGFR